MAGQRPGDCVVRRQLLHALRDRLPGTSADEFAAGTSDRPRPDAFRANGARRLASARLRPRDQRSSGQSAGKRPCSPLGPPHRTRQGAGHLHGTDPDRVVGRAPPQRWFLQRLRDAADDYRPGRPQGPGELPRAVRAPRESADWFELCRRPGRGGFRTHQRTAVRKRHVRRAGHRVCRCPRVGHSRHRLPQAALLQRMAASTERDPRLEDRRVHVPLVSHGPGGRPLVASRLSPAGRRASGYAPGRIAGQGQDCLRIRRGRRARQLPVSGHGTRDAQRRMPDCHAIPVRSPAGRLHQHQLADALPEPALRPRQSDQFPDRQRGISPCGTQRDLRKVSPELAVRSVPGEPCPRAQRNGHGSRVPLLQRHVHPADPP